MDEWENPTWHNVHAGGCWKQLCTGCSIGKDYKQRAWHTLCFDWSPGTCGRDGLRGFSATIRPHRCHATPQNKAHVKQMRALDQSRGFHTWLSRSHLVQLLGSCCGFIILCNSLNICLSTCLSILCHVCVIYFIFAKNTFIMLMPSCLVSPSY